MFNWSLDLLSKRIVNDQDAIDYLKMKISEEVVKEGRTTANPFDEQFHWVAGLNPFGLFEKEANQLEVDKFFKEFKLWKF